MNNMPKYKLLYISLLRGILMFLLLSVLLVYALAQDAKFTASASPNVLRVGEQFNLIYSTDQEISELDPPDIENFELLGGPIQGHSRSVQSVNGKITTESTYQYTYFFRAVKEGKFTLAPAEAKIKNKIYRSNQVTVEVVSGKAATGRQNTPGSQQDEPSQVESYTDNDIYVRLLLDKREAYIGEQVVATVKVFTKPRLAGVNQEFKGPDYTGFFTEPIEVPPLRSLQREAISGDIFFTGVLRRVMIIPQKTGALTIQPFELDVEIRQDVTRKFADPFFDEFAFPEVQRIPVRLRSNSVTVQVKPLPSNAPASFTGAVGKYSLNSTLNKNTTRTNEPLTLRFTISGKGNLKLINEIDMKVPYDMEKYDPVITTRMDNPLSGSKSFEYLIVPRIAGSYVIAPVEFSYFDPEVRQYKTLKSQAYTVEVEHGEGDTLMAVSPGISKEDVRMLNQDIRFIRNNRIKLTDNNSRLAGSPVFYLLYFLALAFFVVLLWVRSRVIRQNSDITGARLRRADKFARKRLKHSAELLKQGNHAAFYEELLGATWGYVGDKLNIPVADLSRDTARDALQVRNVDGELVDELFRIAGECEMARYGQVSGGVAMDKLYHNALDVITRLQQKLK
ncbi:MAG TPA: BatD family protein [Bacteroidales bacterium]|nr:BatD family protein [Bacteroidales bacterium]